jgi:hypothetical protein
LLKPAATGNETVGEGVFFPGVNTLFEGQQINGHTEKRKAERRHTHREERSKTQIKEDPRIRAEEPGPLRDTTSEGPSAL